nr:BCCT family transporter [Leisingera sp. JC1]
MFLAHISKGRTIREIAIGAVMRLLRAKQTDPEPDRRQLP